ncbi:hypothetical protein ACFQ0D_36435, partial [Micromonospora zhanjiangensis]
MHDQSSALPPRHVLCVLGSDLDLDLVERVTRDAGGSAVLLDRDYSQRAADPRMPRAFEAATATTGWSDADRAAVAGHDTVAYLMSPPMTRETSLDVSRRMLVVTAALLRAGATAVKSESSGVGHGRAGWLTLADDAARG